MTINECEGARIGVILACARNGGTNNNVSVSACNGGKGAHGCSRSEDVGRREGGVRFFANAKGKKARLLMIAGDGSEERRRGMIVDEYEGDGVWCVAVHECKERALMLN